MQFKDNNIKKSLRFKLLAAVLLVSGFVTCFITGFQLYWEYSRDVEGVNNRMNQVEQSFVTPIQSSLWELNQQLLESSLDGIIQLSDIEYAEIIDEEGELVARRGLAESGSFVSKRLDLFKTDGARRQFLGTLIIRGSLDEAWERLKDKFIVVFFSQLLKTLITSFLILLIAQFLVTRHLITIYKYFSDNLFKGNHDLKLNRFSELKNHMTDELDLVVKSINKLRSQTNEEFSRRVIAEKELSVLNKKLKEKVELQENRLFEEKMVSSIGTVSRGVIKEINEPIVEIENNSKEALKIIEDDLADKKLITKIIKRVCEQTDNIKSIMNEVEELATNKSESDFRAESLIEIIEKSVNICKNKHSDSDVYVSLDISKTDTKIICDRNQLYILFTTIFDRVFKNLQGISKSWINISLDRDGKYISVIIEDSDKSMDIDLDKVMKYTSEEITELSSETVEVTLIKSIIDSHHAEIKLGTEEENYKIILNFPGMK